MPLIHDFPIDQNHECVIYIRLVCDLFGLKTCLLSRDEICVLTLEKQTTSANYRVQARPFNSRWACISA